LTWKNKAGRGIEIASKMRKPKQLIALFVCLAYQMSHQPTVFRLRTNQPPVLFSQNKLAPTTTNQPAVLFSQNKLAPTTTN
jgi:hypothetical protein